jgi:hypothetical protein
MGYQSDDDELMDAVLLDLQIVGEATGTPMLHGDNLAWLRLELATDLAAPCSVLEALSRPPRLLNGRNVLPSLVVTRTVPMMQCIDMTMMIGAYFDLRSCSFRECSNVFLNLPIASCVCA